MLHGCNVREWEWEGMGKALRESHGNGNWLQNWEWEWEGMGIDCTEMGGSGNVKSHSRASLVLRCAVADVRRSADESRDAVDREGRGYTASDRPADSATRHHSETPPRQTPS